MKICQFNVENLFLFRTQDNYVKSPEKVQWLARTIKEIDADIYMLCEVGGLESLDLFNSKYLDNQYFTALIPGNSDRGIEMGYLIKKALPYFHQLISHKEKPINFNYPHELQDPNFEKGLIKSHLFSRDVSELRLLENGKPKLILFLVHLKSKLDKDGIDFNGNLRRKAEVNRLIELYLETKNQHPHIPIIIGGDFNGNAQRENHEFEFTHIYEKTELQDVLEVISLIPEERHSYFYFTRDNIKEANQLDYIFIPKELWPHVNPKESGIYQYRDQYGVVLSYPKDSFERYALPSDHYPIVIDFKFS